MRRTWGVVAVSALLLAGCDGGGTPVELAVTTPPASATAGTGPTTVPPTSAPPATPDPGGPAPTGDPGGGATTPRGAYAALVAEWQQARARFFGAVSDGSPRTPAQQRALAAAFLTAQRRFGTALRAYPWPAGARTAVTALLASNAAQQATIAAMAGAGSAGEFTGRLADYGVATPAENRAVAAVAAALN